MSAQEKTSTSEPANAGLHLTELLPDFFEKFFAFFQPAHTEGVAPARVKELARLKIASLNGCDT